jgi:DNA polymerase III epsilon subunit-like protein
MNHSSHPLEQTNTDSSPMRYVMVIDTETTGLLPKINKSTGEYPKIEEYPYITQLSFIVFDVIDLYVVHIYNAYIKIPTHIVIPDIVTEITGITRELLEEKGIDIKEAICHLSTWFFKMNCVVAHNLHFDSIMIRSEVKRHYSELLYTCQKSIQLFNKTYCEASNIELYCTMFESKTFCDLKIESKYGTYYQKFPKLSELHEKLFGSIPEDLHNSLVDSLVCLKCFMKYRLHREIHPAKYRHMEKNIRTML